MSAVLRPPGKRVLAIDDDPSLRKLLAGILSTAGFRVEVAGDGEEGLAKIRREAPDLVICDVQMPGMDGFEVLDTLRATAATAGLPCVLVTGRSDSESLRRGMQVGADDFISKPVRSHDLIESVSAVLERRRRQALRSLPATAELAAMTGRMLTQTVLFSDIRGFTAIAERLPVTAVAELLSSYLREASLPILRERGRVMKIMGDGLMAVFGHDAPQDPRAHAAAGLRAAQGIIEAAQRFRSWLAARFDLPGLPPFEVGVGVHTGQVMLFQLAVGGTDDITAVGDTVNVAARLEAKSKQLGWPIVASVDTLRHAGFPASEQLQVELDGRGAPVMVGRVPLPCADASTPDIPGYRVVGKVGEGAMSSAYLAWEEAAARQVVLKVLRGGHGADGAPRKRFFQECAILSAIQHRHVVRLHERGCAGELAYMVMEHLDGGTLRERMQAGMAPREALSLLAQAASGLSAIHGHGIVHRDLKPANIMLRWAGELAIADFGVAKWLARTACETMHGEVFGTPYYMAPEQVEGGEVCPRADLYSLGVIFFEMLTGSRPYQGETVTEILAQHAAAPIPRLPAALSACQILIDGMLAKRPADRFASAGALIEAISEGRL